MSWFGTALGNAWGFTAAQGTRAWGFGRRYSAMGLARGIGAYGAGARKIGAANMATLTGAGIGGAWGAVSDDTSVLGGMVMGAAGGRYGRAAFRGQRAGARAWSEFGGNLGGMSLRGAGGGIRLQGWQDFNKLKGLAGQAKGKIDFDKARGLAKRAKNQIGARLKGNKPIVPAPIDFGRPMRQAKRATGQASPAPVPLPASPVDFGGTTPHMAKALRARRLQNAAEESVGEPTVMPYWKQKMLTGR